MKTITKKILLTFLLGILLSCISNKGILRPDIVLIIYDNKTKIPIENVTINIGKEAKKDLIILSNKKGLAKIPKVEVSYGNYHVLPLIDYNFILSKENYITDSVNYIKYFKMNNNSNRDIVYVSDSIFLVKK